MSNVIYATDSSFDSDTLSVLTQIFSDENVFFGFVLTWLYHITRLVHGSVVWNAIPGYCSLMQTLVRRMLSDIRLLRQPNVLDGLKIRQYNREMAGVMGLFARVLLHTTNLYDKENFNFSIDVLDTWVASSDGTEMDDFSAISDEKPTMSTRIPKTFCGDSFFFAVRSALLYDHFQVVLCAVGCCCLLYFCGRVCCFVYCNGVLTAW